MLDNEIIRPSIDKDNNTITPDGITIHNCTIDPNNNNIIGYTDDNTKALYDYSKNTWYFGSEIGHRNLIPLTNNKDKARELGSIGGKKAAENREKQKNINDLAKAMLEQTMTEDQIQSILGNDTNVLLDSSVASVMLGAMIKSALNGSFKAFEAVRDTAGYKPKNEVEISADIMTDADRSLIDKALKTS